MNWYIFKKCFKTKFLGFKFVILPIILILLLIVVWGWLGLPKQFLINSAGILITTFVGAWAGGLAAFKEERKTKELNRRTEQVCAANKAIFNVAMIGNAFHNLDQQYIHKNGVFDNSNRALIMDSPSYGMMKNIEFNVDELSFFLDQSGEIGPMVLMELMIFEWLYQNLRQAVNLRAEAYEDLHVAIQTGGILDIDFEYIKAHYKPQYAKLEEMTNQMIELVPKGIDDSNKVNQKLQEALRLQFPEQSFLQIKFPEQISN